MAILISGNLPTESTGSSYDNVNINAEIGM